MNGKKLDFISCIHLNVLNVSKGCRTFLITYALHSKSCYLINPSQVITRPLVLVEMTSTKYTLHVKKDLANPAIILENIRRDIEFGTHIEAPRKENDTIIATLENIKT